MADKARVAIVTGSDSGIGRATAVVLAEQGCDLGITWYQSREAAEATAEEVRSLGRRAEVRHLDLTQLPAGTGHRTPLLDLDLGTWREVLATDLDGAFLFSQRVARRMVDAGRGGPADPGGGDRAGRARHQRQRRRPGGDRHPDDRAGGRGPDRPGP